MIGKKSDPYDVIVCGAGHAGVEAALAASRMNMRVLLVTGNIDTVVKMSCNPSIGGQAKGHIVREIDALGGEMGINTDTTAIQFRVLNESKGPAVQAPRAQCDKKAYQFRMKHTLELDERIDLFQAIVSKLIYDTGKVIGIGTTIGAEFYGKTVVVTTGTFLRGLMHIGKNKTEGGRSGDFSAQTLSASIAESGIELGRLKTGTPCRLLGRTINFKGLEEQPGDVDPVLFAFYDTRGLPDDVFHVEHGPAREEAERLLFHVEQGRGTRRPGWMPGSEQLSCWMTYTGDETRRVIMENLHQSALYGGEIKGIGPRYCPSIEDKMVRFANHDRHRLFLEPEGRNTDEWYVNGLSTSMPYDVQEKILASVPGLENARMIRPAYAVEYDFAPPQQLHPWLETKIVENLFFAGQINGTSGYEEAAGQGLVAGVNAALKVRGEPPFVMARHESYIGVLIDDLVTKGTLEPYRMFTSRAEHRLLLNYNSAELRLGKYACEYGLVPEGRAGRIREKIALVNEWVEKLEALPAKGGSFGDMIRRGGDAQDAPATFHALSASTKEEIIYRVRYQGYLERELRQVAKMANVEKISIPSDIDYKAIKGLRIESAQKLDKFRPATLGQASRISGVSPADVSLLMIALAARRA
jgi:tRNA uridine 5-carboxymethylaminomethyl modification enzyme